MKRPLPFRSLGIYGVGLLGGSLGLALKAISPELEIVGIGRSESRLLTAKQLGSIDRYTCDPSTLDEPLDGLILCTPVRLVPKAFQSMIGALTQNALVTDVGSAKGILTRDCEDIAEGRCYFVGSHPMAGSHETGVEAARADLFEGRVCVVTETPRSHKPAVEKIVNLWKRLGMKTVRMSPALHDQLTAYSSHLPHLVAAALCQAARTQGKEIEPVLGNGFLDTTRIAQGDPSMWVDICLDNRKSILGSLLTLRTVLTDLYCAIESSDEEAIRAFLTQAQEWIKTKHPA